MCKILLFWFGLFYFLFSLLKCPHTLPLFISALLHELALNFLSWIFILTFPLPCHRMSHPPFFPLLLPLYFSIGTAIFDAWRVWWWNITVLYEIINSQPVLDKIAWCIRLLYKVGDEPCRDHASCVDPVLSMHALKPRLSKPSQTMDNDCSITMYIIMLMNKILLSIQ